MTGLEIPGECWARKRTGVRTTRRGMAEGLNEYQRDKQHKHVHLDGQDSQHQLAPRQLRRELRAHPGADPG
eukprot:4450867-Pyramimonas_sp.AAC.1